MELVQKRVLRSRALEPCVIAGKAFDDQFFMRVQFAKFNPNQILVLNFWKTGNFRLDRKLTFIIVIGQAKMKGNDLTNAQIFVA